MSLLYPSCFVEDLHSMSANPNLEIQSFYAALNVMRRLGYHDLFEITSMHHSNIHRSRALAKVFPEDVPADQREWPIDGEFEINDTKFIASAWRYYEEEWMACEFIRADLVVDSAPPTVLFDYLHTLFNVPGLVSNVDWNVDNEGFILRRIEAHVHGRIMYPRLFRLPTVQRITDDRRDRVIVHDNLRELVRCSMALRDFGRVESPDYVPYPLSRINSWRLYYY